MNALTSLLRADVEDLPQVFQLVAAVILLVGLACQTVTNSETKVGGTAMVSMFVGVGYLFFSTLGRMATLAA
jgi:hypothetical protein